MVDLESNKEKFTPKVELTHEVLEAIKNGDKELLSLVYKDYERYIYHISFKYSKNYGDDANELAGIAAIGFMKAIEHFDPDREVKFLTFLAQCIKMEILLYFRTYHKAEIPEKPVFTSLDYTIQNKDNSSTTSVAELIPDARVDLDFEAITDGYQDIKNLIKDILEEFSTRDKFIIQGFFSKMPQREIVEKLESDYGTRLSQSYISRIISKFKRKLDKRLLTQGLIKKSLLQEVRERRSKEKEEVREFMEEKENEVIVNINRSSFDSRFLKDEVIMEIYKKILQGKIPKEIYKETGIALSTASYYQKKVNGKRGKESMSNFISRISEVKENIRKQLEYRGIALEEIESILSTKIESNVNEAEIVNPKEVIKTKDKLDSSNKLNSIACIEGKVNNYSDITKYMNVFSSLFESVYSDHSSGLEFSLTLGIKM